MQRRLVADPTAHAGSFTSMATAASYFAFGMGIRSEFPIPELVEVGPDADATVAVRRGHVPEQLPGARRRSPYLQVGEGDDALVTLPGVGRFRLCGGREIVVDPLPEATPRNVRLSLLGSVFGALCHQRGVLPLHANAIEVDGGAIVIAGHSGAGKSTLALHFHDRGYRVLCDDMAAITFPDAGCLRAWPGVPRVRLWRDSAEALGHDVTKLDIAADGHAKYALGLPPVPPRQSLPLSGLYVLQAPVSEGVGQISRLRGAAALGAVMSITYRSAFLEMMKGAHARLAGNRMLLSRVPVYSLPWRRDFDLLAAQVAELEKHMRNAPPCSAIGSATRAG